MRFRYLHDRFFIFCVLIYSIGRIARASDLHHPLLDGYLNDLLCVGFWVPITLLLMRSLGLRRHDDPPHAVEIIVCILIWTFMFEYWLPNHASFGHRLTADPMDVLAYALGGFLAAVIWRWTYTHQPRCNDRASGSSGQTANKDILTKVSR